ncbi:major capsid protein [Paenibacillus sp. 481]|uniref:major capsid protein n=1 Tax=Paenibacillus sp. 481 TaxID=2835869 RepID=UPI001E6215A5|nr:major capsid protein [Paenibacillus sp. 481]UHA74469.1 major capsid protein [Paenibacillus sp. 481]
MPPIDLYDPRTLQRVIESLPPAFSFLKNTFFSGSETSVTSRVDIDFVKGKRRLARYSSPRNLKGKEVKRDGYVTKTFTPVLINPKRVIDGDVIQKRLPGELIYSGQTEEERAAKIVAKDIDDLDTQVSRRKEQMSSELLFSGKIRMKDDDIDEEFDYEFVNKQVLAGTDMWSDPKSDPLAELRRRKATIRQKSSIVPNIVVFSEKTYELFITNPNVIKAMESRRIIRGEIIPRPISAAVDYVGKITELGLEIYVYNEWYVDPFTEEEKPMVPDFHYLMGSSETSSYFNHGAITFIDPKSKQWVTHVAERVARRIVNENDSIEEITLLSRPIPIPENIDAWYVVKVA